jgi:hypothetical protein
MQVKADVRLPLAFATVLAILLGYRVMEYIKSKQPKVATVAK